MAMKPLLLNGCETRLTTAVTTGTTTFNVTAGTGVLFAGASASTPIPFWLKVTDGFKVVAREFCWCTGRSTDALTVLRAQESVAGAATALNADVGSLIEVDISAGTVPALGSSGELTLTIVSSGGGVPGYAWQLGWYDIVGDFARYQFDIKLSSLGTLAAGTITIEGFPFTSHASYGRSPVAFQWNAVNFAYPAQAAMFANTNHITPFYVNLTQTQLSVSDLQATALLSGSGIVRL